MRMLHKAALAPDTARQIQHAGNGTDGRQAEGKRRGVRAAEALGLE